MAAVSVALQTADYELWQRPSCSIMRLWLYILASRGHLHVSCPNLLSVNLNACLGNLSGGWKTHGDQSQPVTEALSCMIQFPPHPGLKGQLYNAPPNCRATDAQPQSLWLREPCWPRNSARSGPPSRSQDWQLPCQLLWPRNPPPRQSPCGCCPALSSASSSPPPKPAQVRYLQPGILKNLIDV